jgi:hypothetical protein
LDLLNREQDVRLYRLRHRSHWTIRRIARWTGLSCGTVSRRLADIEKRLGMRGKVRNKVPRRRVRPFSLSNVFNV